ncbi:uncharacterized protein LOC125378672 [Haliotis rufescens]|uniref:uncharacterized protein LOC125378671 n=1 Tax=Haliotis rufescens TaxID=6454 RepID=UPI00201FB2D3|nr:uncharacterized protein LOC125378671 [Haliotis rufescens]XP_048250556.1 uncharacterized protein LOC125378672 [Haliotis rufescens]
MTSKVIVCLLLVILTLNNTEASLRITSPGDWVFINTSLYGVDIRSCTTMPLQIKACDQAHVWFGDGTPTNSYEIGTWKRAETGFRQCSECYSTEKFYSNPRGIHCDEFRWFWFRWGEGRLEFGEGRIAGLQLVFDEPINRPIEEFRVSSYYYTVEYILGEGYESQYGVASLSGRYSDGLLYECKAWSGVHCATQCQAHGNCHMYSYQKHQAICALYNRDMSSFTLTSETGWVSYQLRYCD